MPLSIIRRWIDDEIALLKTLPKIRPAEKHCTCRPDRANHCGTAYSDVSGAVTP